MKRLIFFIAFVFCFLVGKAQFPITQSIGSPTTLVQVPANGGFRAGIINRTFTDTTAANLTYLDAYQGAQIFTTSDAKFWVRNATATGWIDIAGSGSSSQRISALLAANQTNTIDNANYEQLWRWNSLSGKGLRLNSTTTLADEGQNLLEVSVAGANAQAGIYTYGINVSNSHTGGGINVAANFAATGGSSNYAALFTSGNVGIGTSTPAASSLLDITSTSKGFLPPRMTGAQQNAISSPATGLMIYNTDSSAYCYYTGSVWLKISQGSGSTPTWQQVLTAGSTLTGNNTIDGGGNDLLFDNNGDFGVNGSGGTIYFQNGSGSDNAGINIETSYTLIDAGNSPQGKFNALWVLKDSILLQPNNGQINIDSIRNATTENRLIGWDNVTGRIGALSTIPSGVGVPISSLTAATGTNDINNGDNPQKWRFATTGAEPGITITNTTSGSIGLFVSGNSGSSSKGISASGNTAIIGVTSSATGIGVWGSGSTGSSTIGVRGDAQSASGWGVYGQNSTGSAGLFATINVGGTNNNQVVLEAKNSSSSYNTTSSDLTTYVFQANATATRSSGANNLTQVAGLFTASGAQTNTGIIANGTQYAALFGTTSGNVGIGTSTPAKILHTVGTVRMASLGTASSDTTTYKPVGINSSGDVIPMTYWPGGGGSSGLTIGTTTIASSVSGSVLYDSSGVLSRNDEFYWDRTNKRLGIGVNTPSHKLTVVDNQNSYDIIKIRNLSSSGYASIGFFNSLDAQVGGFGYANSGIGAPVTDAVYFYSNGKNIVFSKDVTVTSSMNINSGGTVGITSGLYLGSATTTPSAMLHSVATTEQLRLGYDGSNYFSTTVGSSGGVTFDAVGSGSRFTYSDGVTLPAGSATATVGSPLKFTTGTNLTTAEAGAMEYATPQLFFTNGAALRQELFQGNQNFVQTQFDKTSSTTLGDVTNLSVSVAAGKAYRFEAILYTTSNVAGGVKAAIGGTATATTIIYEGLTTDAGLTTQSRATSLGTAVGAVTAVTAGYIKITGTIIVNAAGTLTVQFAQNASNGSASSVLVGSTFHVIELAYFP